MWSIRTSVIAQKDLRLCRYDGTILVLNNSKKYWDFSDGRINGVLLNFEDAMGKIPGTIRKFKNCDYLCTVLLHIRALSPTNREILLPILYYND